MPIHEPACAHFSEGDVFDFGTHANDFLLKREESQATETFLVRVPGRGSVPAHTHTDMEQTFVFLSGVGTAVLSQGEDKRVFSCEPGTVMFVPTGWEHSVIAESPEGVQYVTVNAFIPGVKRIGATATGHAEEVADKFPEPTQRGSLSRLELFRTAENTFVRHGSRWAGADFDSLQATTRRDPGYYRVERLGPFEIVHSTTPVLAEFTIAHADAVFNSLGSQVEVFVEGSQSPLSVKPPARGSDIDLLISVDRPEGLAEANAARKIVSEICADLSSPVSVGIVHKSWLRLPNFYSAVSLDPESDDRRWWGATEAERLAEAERRLSSGLESLEDSSMVEEAFCSTIALAGINSHKVLEWRITPRWNGLTIPEQVDASSV